MGRLVGGENRRQRKKTSKEKNLILGISPRFLPMIFPLRTARMHTFRDDFPLVFVSCAKKIPFFSACGGLVFFFKPTVHNMFPMECVSSFLMQRHCLLTVRRTGSTFNRDTWHWIITTHAPSSNLPSSDQSTATGSAGLPTQIACYRFDLLRATRVQPRNHNYTNRNGLHARDCPGIGPSALSFTADRYWG